jgi:Holliday junction resolvase RusA-like endonuclease
VVSTKGGKSRSFTPEKTAKYEQVVTAQAWRARVNERGWPNPDVGGPKFGLTIAVFRSTARGDWDNFGKAISDACNGVLWADDAQVCEAHVKIYECPRGQERVEVEAWVIER